MLQILKGPKDYLLMVLHKFPGSSPSRKRLSWLVFHFKGIFQEFSDPWAQLSFCYPIQILQPLLAKGGGNHDCGH